MNHVIRSIRSEEWPAVKELRLAALKDPVAHLAFLETYEEAVARPDAYWQDRAMGAAVGTTERQQFVAEGPDGVWAGTVVVLVEEAGSQDPFGRLIEQRQGHTVGVFVRPEYRGRAKGVTRALFDAALDWCWGLGLERVRLFVHEKNSRAEAFYRGIGFVATGGTAPVPGDETSLEIEFAIERS
jgi:GNAT superfamily N-acetyltransferase